MFIFEKGAYQLVLWWLPISVPDNPLARMPIPSAPVIILKDETGALVGVGPLPVQSRWKSPPIWQASKLTILCIGGSSTFQCFDLRKTNVAKWPEEADRQSDRNNQGKQTLGSCCSWLVIENYLASTASNGYGGRPFGYCSYSGTWGAQ